LFYNSIKTFIFLFAKACIVKRSELRMTKKIKPKFEMPEDEKRPFVKYIHPERWRGY
jgi:hypothetical protein